ncbi:MAG: EamA family transporter [Cytophagaceae bacterium]|nr:EamA family transporter [Cytophagaceae bacterium]
MTEEIKLEKASKGLLIAAFAAVYIIWGSTYLGIKYAIETLPPALMAGLRFLTAGGILYAIASFKKEPAPTRIHWKNSIVIGFFLLIGGNGIVMWAQHYIDSSITALLITLEPIWIVILLWVFKNQKPSPVIIIGMIIGIAGMVMLTDPMSVTGIQNIDIRGILGVTISTLCWAIGSLFALSAPLPKSAFRSTGMQMLTAGVMFLVIGTAIGEWKFVDIQNFSTESIIAFLYLVFVGSIIGYTAYTFLLKHAHPNHVSTYAYVNPVIAVYLGWAIADEKISGQTIIASVLLIGAVVLITTFFKKQ